MSGTQIINGNSDLDYLNYNRIEFDNMPNATEYRLYRTEGLSTGLLYQGAYIPQFLDTGKTPIAPLTQPQSIGTVYISGVPIPYIENEGNILTLQYPSPVSAEIGADALVQDIKGNPTYFTLQDDKILIYPVADTEKNMYLSYYSTNQYMNRDQDTIPFQNTMVAVYYLQWKMLLKANNGMDTPESTEKAKQYKAQLRLLRTKDNNGKTTLRPKTISFKGNA
jgi:hypothetical protein